MTLKAKTYKIPASTVSLTINELHMMNKLITIKKLEDKLFQLKNEIDCVRRELGSVKSGLTPIYKR
jgi:hypothetical protein